jgi:hypothetical protein
VKEEFEMGKIWAAKRDRGKNSNVSDVTIVTALANSEKGKSQASTGISSGRTAVSPLQKRSTENSTEQQQSATKKHYRVNFTRSSQKVKGNLRG